MHESQADITREIEALAQRVLGALEPADARKSAWDLKMELKVAHTQLHLALGWLAGRGRVVLSEGPMTLLVERPRPLAAPEPPAPRSSPTPTAP